ncbi:P-loop NTPase fold protein [Streptomyces marincola]|uniref:P-loop NTPase fold protein n=1 Tax=Streptomyces marincola TaxID=2878388 RepID=UPI001CF10D04|nr:P-loop NTPase fold protein [Streptomyces marincola]UCM86530.1 hypothetical protein LC193_00405 [Streptomyces marincola]
MTFQVPPGTAHFVDRATEQAAVLAAVADRPERTGPLRVGLNGLAGVGKTELAFRLARTLRDRYPDGVLFVDLDDLRQDGTVDLSDALGELLRALDVAPDWLERSFKARCRQYWTRTDGKRLVVIVDNARFGAEVVPLLPASDASLVIAVSHGPLHDIDGGLTADLALSPFADADAAELLRSVVDDPRLTAEPDAATGIVRLCSGLPAAVHVAGRWLRRHRRRPLARLLTDLGTELHERGLPVVERVWDAAYRELGEDAARLYRLLGQAPGRSFTAETATALLGRGRDAADDALEELEAAGLLDGRRERMRMPDLLRAHAARCAARTGDDGGERERTEALRRCVRWFLRQAQRADLAAAGPRLTLAPEAPELPGAPDVEFGPGAPGAGGPPADPKGSGHRWLEAERHTLHACVRLAHRLGLDAEAWALCEPLWTHFLDHPRHAEAIETFRVGVLAASRAEDLPALVRMRCQLARPLWEHGGHEAAERELAAAAVAADALGASERDRKLAASTREFRGMLHAARGRWEAAAADYEEARRLHAGIPNPYGVLLLTYRLGEAVAALGDLPRAVALLTEAHSAARDMGRERMTARTGFALGTALAGLGRAAEAHALYTAALASARRRGSGHDEARVLDALAHLAENAGRPAEAHEHREAARAVRVRHGALTPQD